MGNLLIQVASAILAAYISLITLKRDLRSKTSALKDEALLIKKVIIAITIFSICNLLASYTKSQNDQVALNNDKASLNKKLTVLGNQNDSLRKQLNSSTIAQSKLITATQKQSAEELSKAARNLTILINGSDKLPVFFFVVKSNLITDGVIRNLDDKPIYNVMFKITNYSNLLNCPTKTTNFTSYKYDCYTSNTVEIPLITSFNGKSGQTIALPKYDNNAINAKYLIMVSLNNKIYYEEAIYSISDKNHLSQALRIVDIEKGKIITLKKVSDKDNEMKNINWNKEFPIPLDIKLMQF